MSMNKKAKAQTYDTGLYGSATTNKRGTTYNPTDFEKNLVNMTTTYIPQYLEQLVNPTYDSEVFQAQTAQRNRLANQSFENNLMNPLASRGLTRGSSINQMSNQFANKLADLEVDAMANEDTRNANMINNLLSYYQIPYTMMSKITDNSNKLYQQAVQNARADNLQRYNMVKDMVSGGMAAGLGGGQGGGTTGGTTSSSSNSPSTESQVGSLAGAGIGYYFGGPAGASIGSQVGGNVGNYFS